jgi:hypothetical protein
MLLLNGARESFKFLSWRGGWVCLCVCVMRESNMYKDDEVGQGAFLLSLTKMKKK